MNVSQSTFPEAILFIRILKALGDENRFQIIRLLLKNDLCVGALARILKISKPAVSQHLKLLREAGLVRGEKIGYWTHYRVDKELINEASLYLQELIKVHPDLAETGSYSCLRKTGRESDQERRALEMCKNCCENPDKLKTKAGECTPEQIKECHGEAKEHPCECKTDK